MKKHIQLSDMLRAIDMNDLSFYENLSDDGKKEFSSWMAMRWGSCSDSNPEHYLLMVNSLVNVDFSALSKHPDLQWKLLSICGTGSHNRHSWVAPPKKEKTDRIFTFLISLYPEMKKSDIEMLKKMLDDSEIKDLAKSAGYSDKDIKELMKK